MKTSLMNKKSLNYIKVVKGIFGAYLLTIILFLILGGVLHFTHISEGIIPHAVTFLSAIGIMVSSIRITKDVEQLGWLHGGLIGVFYVAILLMLRLFIGDSVSFNYTAIIDIGMGFVVGVIGGILGVNI